MIRRLSTSPHAPFSITVSSFTNQLFVGTEEGMILVYQNGCNRDSVYLSSMLFDPNGYMVTTCWYPTNKLYLFSPNASFTGKSITTPSYPNYIGFDSKSRFIQISWNKISIYN